MKQGRNAVPLANLEWPFGLTALCLFGAYLVLIFLLLGDYFEHTSDSRFSINTLCTKQ